MPYTPRKTTVIKIEHPPTSPDPDYVVLLSRLMRLEREHESLAREHETTAANLNKVVDHALSLSARVDSLNARLNIVDGIPNSLDRRVSRLERAQVAIAAAASAVAEAAPGLGEDGPEAVAERAKTNVLAAEFLRTTARVSRFVVGKYPWFARPSDYADPPEPVRRPAADRAPEPTSPAAGVSPA